MHDRKAKIPLDMQLMMASGPINNREVAYYPWTDQPPSKAGAGQPAKVQQQVQLYVVRW